MKLTLIGRVPSKKNSKMMVCRGAYPMLLPSKKYSEWHKDASLQLLGKKPITTPITEMIVELYAPDKRKSDLSNKVESIQDLLVDNGIISDDNWFVLPKVTMIFKGVDTKNPRVIIEIL